MGGFRVEALWVEFLFRGGYVEVIHAERCGLQ